MENLSFEDVFCIENAVGPSKQCVYLFAKSTHERKLQIENKDENVYETRFGCFGDFITGWDKVRNITVHVDSLRGIPHLYFLKSVTHEEKETWDDSIHDIKIYKTSSGVSSGQLLFGNVDKEYEVKRIEKNEIIVISKDFLPLSSTMICLTFEGIISRMKYTYHSRRVDKNKVGSDWKEYIDAYDLNCRQQESENEKKGGNSETENL